MLLPFVLCCLQCRCRDLVNGEAVALEPGAHVKAALQHVPHVCLLVQDLQQRQHRLQQQPVIRISSEAQHRHTVVGLVQEGQGGIVHQHSAVQVTVQSSHVFHTLVVLRLESAFPVDAPGKQAAAGVNRVNDGARVVLQPRREDDDLREGAQLLQELAQPRALHHEDALRVELAAHPHHVRLDVGRQAGRAARREAADEGAVQVQKHRQLTPVNGQLRGDDAPRRRLCRSFLAAAQCLQPLNEG
mmetsp:Transcript_3278/g.7175  ORF Transcript_3278/g.7175 Transcript_3278/m.7175 type:complete len:244 (-) Transcript_3278:995-1726(-)